jgi:hypothetical protein
VSETLLLPAPRTLVRLAGKGPPRDAQPALREDRALAREAFTLTLRAGGIELAHRDAAGLAHARECLRQLRAQSGARLPALRIEDAPDFAVRGLMLDVSRNRVPTRETLAGLVERMARLRLNHLQLYTEHTFAYRDHERVWRDASPLTPDDVRWLDGLCAARHIELCANQNTFGHMAPWLAHPAYRPRAETPAGFETRLGGRLAPATLAATPENAAFALGLCRELLACHASRRINVNCDETLELGRGASAAAVAARGRARVYLEHLLRIVTPLIGDGCDVLFWADMLREHPELVRELPRRGLTALAWHYEAPLDARTLPDGLLDALAEFGITARSVAGFAAHVETFADTGFPYWVCPGTSTWNSLAGRWSNARENLRDAAAVGLARGARGFLITDWGDNGHLQPPSASWLPVAYGAGLAWCAATNRARDPAPALDAFVFEDASGNLGGALVELAELYRRTGKRSLNASPLFGELVRGVGLGAFGSASREQLADALERIGRAEAALGRARPTAPDGTVVVRELALVARLLRHGVWRMAAGVGLSVPPAGEQRADFAAALAEQRECWLARSRPGGLEASLGLLRASVDGGC